MIKLKLKIMNIFALSSGPGVSGVAVIRISGPDTAKIIKSMSQWLPAKEKEQISNLRR